MLVRLERVDLQLLELIVESTMWQESGSVKYIRHGYQFTTVPGTSSLVSEIMI